MFKHPTSEPWNTIGVFLKLAGQMPERGKGWFRKYYPKYGHTREQMDTAVEVGQKLGEYIVDGCQAEEIQFTIPVSINTSHKKS